MGHIKRNRSIALLTLATIFITGCSVAPKPLSPEDLKTKAKEDLNFLNSLSKPISEPITLNDAITRAINNNIRNKVQMMETALSHKQIDLVYYDMLPSLTTNAGYSARSNYAASASTTFQNGQPAPLPGTPTYSISQDKQRSSADISFSWNVLDFGLSYVRAQQQSDKYLMAKESQRKVVHNIVQEVRRTYYKTVSADALLKKIIPMMKEVQIALADSKKIKKLRLNSPMQALEYQRDLLEVLRSLQTLERNLSSAKIELSELMGLKAGTSFHLAQKVKKDYELPNLYLDVRDMEKIALENRPEVLESRYKERISQKETTTAILKMLPGINLNAGLSYNNSDYLLNNDWMSVGTSVSWNLLNIFKGQELQKLAKTQIELAKEQKLAVSMAVLSQVHLSLVNFNQAKKEYLLSKEYLDVAQEIFELARVNNQLNISSKLVFIKEKLNFILASLRHSSSYANVQNSYGRIFASLGTYEDINKKPETKKKTVTKKMEDKKSVDSSRKNVVKPVIIKTKVNPNQLEEKKTDRLPRDQWVKIGVSSRNIYLKDSPDFNSSNKMVLRKNQKIRVLDKFMNENGYWIETPVGFVQAKFIGKTFLSALSENANLDKIGKDEKIIHTAKTFRAGNIRVKADWNSDKRYLLQKNQTIDIYDTVNTKNGVWYKTKYGYISSLVVKIQEKK